MSDEKHPIMVAIEEARAADDAALKAAVDDLDARSADLELTDPAQLARERLVLETRIWVVHWVYARIIDAIQNAVMRKIPPAGNA